MVRSTRCVRTAVRALFARVGLSSTLVGVALGLATAAVRADQAAQADADPQADASVGALEAPARSLETPPAPPPGSEAERLTALGRFFETADPPSRDLPKAHDLYCRAAILGHPDAVRRLARLYLLGRGVPVDESVGGTLLRWAARLAAEPAEPAGSPAAAQRTTAAAPQRREDPPDAPATCLQRAGIGSIDELLAKRRPEAPAAPTADVLAAPARFRTGAVPPDQRRIVEMVVRQARAFRLDPRLVLAIVRTESNFDPAALSPKNAQGLMQLIPDTARRFGVVDVLDPLENLKGGMAYLRWLLAYYRGDVALTLAAYNAGEGTVDRFRGVPPYAETIAYVQRIRALYPFDRHPFEIRAAPGTERSWIARDLAATDPAPSPRTNPAATR
jgi:soluble lytic murein transglycosylase-like protein